MRARPSRPSASAISRAISRPRPRSAKRRPSTALGEHDKALEIYERLTADKTTVNDQILLKLSESARAAGDRKKTAEALVRIYYEYPLTDSAVAAATNLEPLRDLVVRSSYKLDLGRAVQLFGARRYAEARAAFAGPAEGRERRRSRARRSARRRMRLLPEALRRRASTGSSRISIGRRARPKRGSSISARCAGSATTTQFIALTQALVARVPRQLLGGRGAEQSRHALHRAQRRRDRRRRRSRSCTTKFPTGPRAERAAWKYGLVELQERRLRRNGPGLREARRRRSRAPTIGRRSSIGRRARTASWRPATDAESRLRLVYADYANSYYGRLAARTLAGAGRGSPRRRDAVARVAPAARDRSPPMPPTAGLIRLLLAAGLYDDALNELRYAQRRGRLVARDRGDDRVGLPPEGGAAPRHHADAPRLSAVPHRRRSAAARDPRR